MAAAAARKAPTKTAMANPPGSAYRAPAKKTTAKKNTSLAKAPAKKTTYRRNPSPTTNAALLAIGGALTVVGFDEVINRFLPTISAPFRIGGKVVAGWAIGSYGKKYLGAWATVIQGALWFSAAYDGFNTWIRPMLGGWLSPTGAPAIVAQEQVQNQATGELGMRYRLSDGNSFDVFAGESQMAYA